MEYGDYDEGDDDFEDDFYDDEDEDDEDDDEDDEEDDDDDETVSWSCFEVFPQLYTVLIPRISFSDLLEAKTHLSASNLKALR